MASLKPASLRHPPERARRPAPDPSPELALRRLLHAAGLRFALRSRQLPGNPDLVLPRRRSVVFVRGCFWHGHDCAQAQAAPNFKVGAWADKIAANRQRHQLDQAQLQAAGWHVETVWECQLEQAPLIAGLAARLRQR